MNQNDENIENQVIESHDEHIQNLTAVLSIKNENKLENIELIHYCKNCGQLGEKKITPHEKNPWIILQQFTCQICGDQDFEYKRNIINSEKGVEIQLNVKNIEDLQRDVFKSITASLQIPELDLELNVGTLGSCFCSVQDLIKKIYINLRDNNPFKNSNNQKYKDIIQNNLLQLQKYSLGQEQFTLIIRDLINSSFISKISNDDKCLQIEEFIRTEEENSELGYDTMNTENYESTIK